MFKIRPLNPASQTEILSVAQRMQRTLMDVMGADKGGNYYSLEWLIERVHWHLQLKENAQIFLCEKDKIIVAQAIIRKEFDEFFKQEIGFFSTIYVEPDFRRMGVAKLLISHVHDWCREKELTTVSYNTARNNGKLIALYQQLGYQQVLETDEMVKLAIELRE